MRVGPIPSNYLNTTYRLYDKTFTYIAQRTALEGLGHATDPKYTEEIKADVLNYLERSFRLSYFVRHSERFPGEDIPDR